MKHRPSAIRFILPYRRPFLEVLLIYLIGLSIVCSLALSYVSFPRLVGTWMIDSVENLSSKTTSSLAVKYKFSLYSEGLFVGEDGRTGLYELDPCIEIQCYRLTYKTIEEPPVLTFELQVSNAGDEISISNAAGFRAIARRISPTPAPLSGQ